MLHHMSSLLLKHARVLATMDDAGTEIPDGGLFAVDGFIEQVGPTTELPETADEVIDATVVRLAAHAVSDLGPDDARRRVRRHPDGAC